MKYDKQLNSLLERIGQGLIELRKKKGYEACKDFVTHYELPPIQYWRMEHGKSNVTLKSLKKVLDIHKVTVLDFFNMI